MKHIVSIGGGLSSTIELPLAVIAKYGAENVDMVIACLQGEHPDLWRLVADCERLTGKHVTRISYAPVRKYVVDAPPVMWWDIWDVFNQQGMMGNSLADPCSRVLKRETLKAYITSNYDPADTVLHVGITADEIDRMMAIQANWGRAGYKVEALLADNPPTVETREQRALRLVGWVPEMYLTGFSHHNCGGFCVKAGHAQLARLLYYQPQWFEYHAQRELWFQQTHHTDATIMRDKRTRNGITTTTPLSLYAFADRMRERWSRMLPGFDPFGDLEEMAACKWCEAA